MPDGSNGPDPTELELDANLIEPKLPGGPKRMRPIAVGNDEFYDQRHPPKRRINSDGKQSLIGGIRVDKDTVYSERYWERQNQKYPGAVEGLRQAFADNIHRAVGPDGSGYVSSFISTDGLTEDDKEKLAAYRKMATELGYDVGEYVLHLNSGTAVAPIKKRS